MYYIFVEIYVQHETVTLVVSFIFLRLFHIWNKLNMIKLLCPVQQVSLAIMTVIYRYYISQRKIQLPPVAGNLMKSHWNHIIEIDSSSLLDPSH
jgi:hypothetical protein